MSENKRKMTKVTVESVGKTTAVEVDAFAGIALKEMRDGHEVQVVLVGDMSVSDLMALHKAIERELLPLIKKEAVNDFFKTLEEETCHGCNR